MDKSDKQKKTLDTVDVEKVFIVHGKDENMKKVVSNHINRIGLEPIILHEQDDKGFTIIEKLEANSNVDFAVVLFSPDDKGHLATSPEKSKR